MDAHCLSAHILFLSEIVMASPSQAYGQPAGQQGLLPGAFAVLGGTEHVAVLESSIKPGSESRIGASAAWIAVSRRIVTGRPVRTAKTTELSKQRVDVTLTAGRMTFGRMFVAVLLERFPPRPPEP